MSRAERLLDLLQVLRRHRRPVSGAALAARMGVSLRTLYRDIASLQAQGASIEGEAGVGYVLRPGFTLPPLMFSAEEIEALVLGTRWVSDRTDARLAAAAEDALAKIAAILPPDLADSIEGSALLIGPGRPQAASVIDLGVVRKAIRTETKLHLAYRNGQGLDTERLVWPFALAFFDHVRMVVAWCELRQEFRHFRADRIARIAETNLRYPRRRPALLQAWRLSEHIPPRSPDRI